jgi:hypothetical protein
MCQNATGETCVFSNFCSKCQLLVDLVAAESHRDTCKLNLEKAEKIVSEKKLKADGNKEKPDESDKTKENDDQEQPPLVSALASTKSSPKKKNGNHVRW